MTERSEVAALGAIVAALAIVALGRIGLGSGEPAPRADDGDRVGAERDGARDASRPRPAPEALAALRDGGTIDLNCADAATLELLPGVGPALARRIVQHRATIGRFATIDGLDAVQGVGAKTLARVRPLLSVAPSTCPTSTTPTR